MKVSTTMPISVKNNQSIITNQSNDSVGSGPLFPNTSKDLYKHLFPKEITAVIEENISNIQPIAK